MSDKLSDLSLDPENARRHNPRNVGMIVDALHEVGAARSIVIDEDDKVLAGNATVEAAMEAGIDKLKIVEADGEELIAVRRTGLSERQKKRLAYFDNRTGELADWDAAQLLADVQAGLDFEGLFFDEELSEIMQKADIFLQLDMDDEVEGFADGNQFGEMVEVTINMSRQKLNELSGKVTEFCEEHDLQYRIKSAR